MHDTATDRLEQFRQRVTSGEELLDRALDGVIDGAGDELDLITEIGGLRLLLHRAMAIDALDGDAYECGYLVAELVRAITRAVRTQREIAGAATDDLAAAVDRVLEGLGLGEGGDGGS